MNGCSGGAAIGCYPAAMLGLRWMVLCGACIGLACGDDSPTNRPPEGQTSSAATTFSTFTSTNPTSISTSDTTDTDGSGTDTDTASESSSSTTGEDDVCPTDTHRCVVDVPEGWEGPAAVLAGEADARRPACDAAYPDVGTMGFEGLDAPEAACQCDCGEADGAECDTSTTLRFWGSSAECSEGASTQFDVFAGVCTNLPTLFPSDSFWQIDVVTASGGSCDPVDGELLPEYGWDAQVVACGGAELLDQGCANGRTCAPRPASDDAALCIWRLGEQECPEGWDEPRTLFTSVNDARGCAPCTCSDPVGVCDEARLTMTGNTNCAVPIANQFDVDGDCHEGSGVVVRSTVMSTGVPNAFCTPSEPMPVGEAIGADPITLCCAE